jgi:hypothetical protein
VSPHGRRSWVRVPSGAQSKPSTLAGKGQRQSSAELLGLGPKRHGRKLVSPIRLPKESGSDASNSSAYYQFFKCWFVRDLEQGKRIRDLVPSGIDLAVLLGELPEGMRQLHSPLSQRQIGASDEE